MKSHFNEFLDNLSAEMMVRCDAFTYNSTWFSHWFDDNTRRRKMFTTAHMQCYMNLSCSCRGICAISKKQIFVAMQREGERERAKRAKGIKVENCAENNGRMPMWMYQVNVAFIYRLVYPCWSDTTCAYILIMNSNATVHAQCFPLVY